jgi:protein SCO1/2
MNKKAFYALLIAVALPVVCYLLVDLLAENAVVMPRRYFPDTIRTITKNGRSFEDTVWHKVRDFELTNQLGDKVSWKDLEGRIVVVDFFFTSCPSICPAMTRNMKRIMDAYESKNDTIVRFISFTVDPVRDSAVKLKAYADKYGIDHTKWWFLTGPKEEIYDLALTEFKASLADTEVDTAFIHTDRFFLLDKDRVVRGWYHGTDSINLDRLAFDISLLNLEKDKKKKRNLFRK